MWAILCVLSAAPIAAPQQASSLAAPLRVEATGGPIDVTTGHAAPCVVDVDGDGVFDLAVGEFGSEPVSADGLPSGVTAGGRAYVEGRVRIYRNAGSNEEPRFGDYEYLRAGGRIAAIPNT